MSVSFFPRIVASEFAPVFRLLDNYAAAQASPRATRVSQSFRSFQPRFDVKESKDSYELQGEFPGFDQKDINIEFTDANTLSIKGRSERRREEGARPAPVAQAEKEQEQPKAVAESEYSSSSYHKPSVEEEGYETVTMSGANPDATPAETPAESVAEPEKQEVAEAAPKTPSSRYWLSERSVGQFARTFSFPNRVDQERVKASLKNGLLNITIPKTVLPPNKHIDIE